jgi:hypothetical protein
MGSDGRENAPGKVPHQAQHGTDQKGEKGYDEESGHPSFLRKSEKGGFVGCVGQGGKKYRRRPTQAGEATLNEPSKKQFFRGADGHRREDEGLNIGEKKGLVGGVSKEQGESHPQQQANETPEEDRASEFGDTEQAARGVGAPERGRYGHGG